jgi:outer membrane protein assembly factor BamB
MHPPRSPLRRWLVAGLTAAVFAGVLLVVASNRAPVQGDESKKEDGATGAWPLFGGTVQRNMVNLTEKNVPIDFDPVKKTGLKWAADLGSKAYGGPVVSGGKVFIGTNNDNPRNPKITGDKGVVMCFRESDGKFLWQSVHDKLAAGRVQDWPREGICSSAVVKGNRLYYVCNRCEVICADVEGDQEKQEAKILWKLDMIKELGVFPHNLATCSPLIVGDLLFVITSNGVDEGHINIPAPDAPSFLCIDISDPKQGKVKWKSNIPGRNIMHGQWSNPVYAEPNQKPMIIFPGGDGYIYAFKPDSGDLLWKFDCNPKSAVYKLGGKGTKNDFVSTPIVWENKLYIGVGQDPEHDEGVGHLWCIDITKEPKNKEKDLSPVNDNFDPRAPVNKDSGLVWHFGGEDPVPKELDRNYVFGRTLSTCAVHDGLLYTCELAGWVHCLDAKTGKEYWNHNMNAACWSSPYWVDGKFFMGNDDGNLLVFKHGKEKEILAEIDMKGKVRATPVAINGTLFVMTENRLHAFGKK